MILVGFKLIRYIDIGIDRCLHLAEPTY